MILKNMLLNLLSFTEEFIHFSTKQDKIKESKPM